MKCVAAEPPNIPPFQDGDRVCWVGDSITHWGEYSINVATFWLTRYPKLKIQYVNSGISGNHAASILQRFDFDVATWKPTYVTLMLGMNDVGWAQYEAGKTPEERKKGREGSLRQWRQDMPTLLDRIIALRPKPRAFVLLSPTVYDEYTKADMPKLPARVGTDPDLGRLGETARQMAVERKLPWLDWRGPLLDVIRREQTKDPKFTIIPDRSHPNPAAHWIMAATFLGAQGVTPYTGEIAVDAAAKTISGKQCEAKDLTVADGKIAFCYLPESLPFPSQVKGNPILSGLTDFAGKEILSIKNLTDGNYELKIDDAALGAFTAKQLADGVDLAALPNSPQVKQAAEVIAKFKERAILERNTIRKIAWCRAVLIGRRHGNPSFPTDNAAAGRLMAEKCPPCDQPAWLKFVELIEPANTAKWQQELKAMEDAANTLNKPKNHIVAITKVEKQ